MGKLTKLHIHPSKALVLGWDVNGSYAAYIWNPPKMSCFRINAERKEIDEVAKTWRDDAPELEDFRETMNWVDSNIEENPRLAVPVWFTIEAEAVLV